MFDCDDSLMIHMLWLVCQMDSSPLSIDWNKQLKIRFQQLGSLLLEHIVTLCVAKISSHRRYIVCLAVVNKCTSHYIKTTNYIATLREEHFHGQSVTGQARLQTNKIVKTTIFQFIKNWIIG